MAYEQESKKSRVVVETPTARREVTQTEVFREPERGGISGATVGVIVVLGVAIITVLVLLLMSQRTETANDNLAAQQTAPPQTTIVQQPAQQQPPVIIQQAPAPQQAPIIITQPAGSSSTSSGAHDSAIQMEIDKRIMDHPTFSTLGVTVNVLDGKATLIGTVNTEGLKSQLEKFVLNVRGVQQVDNQIVVS